LWQLAQIGVAIIMVSGSWSSAHASWTRYVTSTADVPLHGIWNITELSVGDESPPPRGTDPGQWRRFVFEQRGMLAIQTTADTTDYRSVVVDLARQTLTVRRGGARTGGVLAVERPDDDHLILTGDLDQRPVVIRLQRQSDDFLLVARGFRWIQDVPFNR
jgi:hypothetical protein